MTKASALNGNSHYQNYNLL